MEAQCTQVEQRNYSRAKPKEKHGITPTADILAMHRHPTLAQCPNNIGCRYIGKGLAANVVATLYANVGPSFLANVANIDCQCTLLTLDTLDVLPTFVSFQNGCYNLGLAVQWHAAVGGSREALKVSREGASLDSCGMLFQWMMVRGKYIYLYKSMLALIVI